MKIKELKAILDKCDDDCEINCYIRNYVSPNSNSYMETFYPIICVHENNANKYVVLDLNYNCDGKQEASNSNLLYNS